MENQRKIMEGMGLECAHTLPPDSKVTAPRKKWPFSLSSVVSSHVRAVKQYINWRLKRMSNINKGTLLMLLSAIANFLKTTYGWEMPGDAQMDVYADLILWLLTLAGVVMNFTKKKKTPNTQPQQQEEVEGYYH
jgi:uncharacterized membrane protein